MVNYVKGKAKRLKKIGGDWMKKKLTKKKIDYFIKDEKHATKEYKAYGLKSLSKDEAGHAKFLKKLEKKKKY